MSNGFNTMGLTNLNKIIDIDFITEAGIIDPTARIKTPAKGRKPNIEITGQILPNDETLAISVIIKNLYMDLTKQKYQRVRITAGYENGQRIAMDGTILYMYQASPGPESEIVMQLMPYVYKPWQETQVDLKFENGYTLRTILEDLSLKMGFNVPDIQPGLDSTINAPFYFSGAAKDAAAKIREHYKDVYPDLSIIATDTKIKAFSLSKGTGKTYKINYLKSPPQLVGGGTNAVSATITAPWQPEIKPGDKVIVNTGFYSTTNKLFNTQQEMTIKVNTIDFHFSTVGRANQMVIMGIKASE